MSKASQKPTFIRTEIPRVEKLLGAGILVLLAAVGVAVGIKGHRYDPAKFKVDPATLEFTRAAVTGKAATLRTDDGLRSFVSATRGERDGGAVLPPPMAGLSPTGPTEHYTPDTLFEKINGRAPAYFEFGFRELTARSFRIPEEEGQFLDILVFTMDNPLNAFGIFSLERGNEAQGVDFAPDGYRSEMGYFFRKGSAYVQVIASEVSEPVMTRAEQAARALAAKLPGDGSDALARSLLPADGQVPGSLSFIRQNAYGHAALKNAFEARYRAGESELTYFAAPGADDAYETLRDFYSEYGTIREDGERAGARFFVAESFGQVSVIHTDGKTLAGVMNADDAEAARGFVEYVLGQANPE